MKAALLLAWALTAAALGEEAVVSRVIDGDTVWLQTPQRARIKARLYGIDAPERCQRGGAQARLTLSQWLLKRRVQVSWMGSDSWGRELVRLNLDGQDVGQRMVAQGWAWAYRWRGQISDYQAWEHEARQAQRGVFAQPAALHPSAFRRLHGPCQ